MYGDGHLGGRVGVLRNQTMEVGSFPPNAWGLHDMHGNVDEWCQDWFDWYYYEHSPRINPKGPASRKGLLNERMMERVSRGAAWSSHPDTARSGRRVGLPHDLAIAWLGFRVASDPQ